MDESELRSLAKWEISHHYMAAGRLRNVCAIGSLRNTNLYTSEQTCVSIKSNLDLR